jgi:hypothetical protein
VETGSGASGRTTIIMIAPTPMMLVLALALVLVTTLVTVLARMLAMLASTKVLVLRARPVLRASRAPGGSAWLL